ARLQAAAGRRVSSLRHRVVELEEPDRRLLCLLDGTRDRVALVESLPELAPEGLLEVRLRGFADAALLLAWSSRCGGRCRGAMPIAGAGEGTPASLAVPMARRVHYRCGTIGVPSTHDEKRSGTLHRIDLGTRAGCPRHRGHGPGCAVVLRVL